jgi:hypothetical protein
MKFYREILDTWNYIVVNVQVTWISGTYYLSGSKLLDKSYQILEENWNRNQPQNNPNEG